MTAPAARSGRELQRYLQKHPDVAKVSTSTDNTPTASVEKMAGNADLSFICQPAEVARIRVELLRGKGKIIDCSSTHRDDDSFVYGLPEMTAWKRNEIAKAELTANPGAFATAFLLAAVPAAQQHGSQ